MNNSINRFFVILFLLWLVHMAGILPGEAMNTASVKFDRGDAIADRPVARQPREKGGDTANGTQTPQGRRHQQEGNSGTIDRKTSKGEFVPSEEIKAEQAVDFPADI